MGILKVTDPYTGLPTPIRIDGDQPTETEQQRINEWAASRTPQTFAEPAPVVEETQGSLLGVPGDIMQGASRGFLGSFAQVPGGLTALGEAAFDQPIGSTGIGALGKSVTDTLQSGVDYIAPEQDTVGGKIGQAAGSLVSFLVPGAAGAKVASTLGKSAAAGATIGASAMGAPLGTQDQLARIEQQIAQGNPVSEEDIRAAVIAGGGIGLSEGLPIGRVAGRTFDLLRKVPREAKEEALLTIGNRLKRAGKAGLEEGLQEVMASVMQDLTEKGIYNPDVQVGQSAADDFAYGGGAGAGLQMILDAVAGRRIATGRQLRDDLISEGSEAVSRRDNAARATEEVAATQKWEADQQAIVETRPVREEEWEATQAGADAANQNLMQRLKANAAAREADRITAGRLGAAEAQAAEADDAQARIDRARAEPVGMPQDLKRRASDRKGVMTKSRNRRDAEGRAAGSAANAEATAAETQWQDASTQRQAEANRQRNAEIVKQKEAIVEADRKDAVRTLKKAVARDDATIDVRAEGAGFSMPRTETSRLAINAAQGRLSQAAAPAAANNRPTSVLSQRITPEIRAQLKQGLDDAGLGDVDLSLVGTIEGDGAIAGRELGREQGAAIELAGNIYDPDLSDAQLTERLSSVLNHEMIHALRTMDLFNSSEFSALARAAASQKRVGPDGKKRKYSYLDYQVAKNSMLPPNQQLSPDILVEEAIAEMYQDHANPNNALKLAGRPQSLLKKIIRFIKAIGTMGRSLDVERGAAVVEALPTIAGRERNVKRMGIRPSNAARAERYSRAVEKTPAFKSWANQGDDLLRDDKGDPVILYRGGRFMPSGILDGAAENFQLLKPRDGYAVFASNNPWLANTYGNPTSSSPEEYAAQSNSLDRDITGMVVPFYAKAKKIIPFQNAVQRGDQSDDGGSATFNMFQFDNVARRLAKGEVVRVENVRDTGPTSNLSVDPEYKWSYGSDVYAFQDLDVRPVFSFPATVPAPPARYSKALDMFQSPLLKALENSKQTKAPAKQWKSSIANMDGIKKDELEWLGVNEWLDMQEGQVQKTDLLNFIADHQITLVEYELGGIDEEVDEYDTAVGISQGDAIEPDESDIDWREEQNIDYLFEDALADQPYEPNEDQTQNEYEDELRESLREQARDMAYEDYYENAPRVAFATSNDGGEYVGTYYPDDDSYVFPDVFDDNLDEYDAIERLEEDVRSSYGASDASNRGFDGPSRHISYTEDGGEDYREIMIAMPDLEKSGKNRVDTSRFDKREEKIEEEYLQVKRRRAELRDMPVSELTREENDAIDAEYKQLAERSVSFRDQLGQVVYERNQYLKQAAQPSQFVVSSHFEQPNIVVHTRVKDREGPSGERVLFIEEIQSDLAAKWRGFNPALYAKYQEDRKEVDQVREEQFAAEKALEDLMIQKGQGGGIYREIYRTYQGGEPDSRTVDVTEYNNSRRMMAAQTIFNMIERDADKIREQSVDDVFMTENEAIVHVFLTDPELYDLAIDAAQKRDAARDIQQELYDKYQGSNVTKPNAPETPFQQEAAYGLMVKRMIREAAENGYSAVAWTPGYMQAERWSAAGANVIEEVQWSPSSDADLVQAVIRMQSGNAIDTMVEKETGEIKATSDMGDRLVGRKLSELVSPPIANRVLSEEAGTVSGQAFTLPDSGYAVAYDQQIRKAFEKVAKKSGARVKPSYDMPDFKVPDADVVESRKQWLLEQDKGAVEIAADILTNREAMAEAGLMDPEEYSFDLLARIDADNMTDGWDRMSRNTVAADDKAFDLLYPGSDAKKSKPVWMLEMNDALKESAMQPMSLYSRAFTPQDINLTNAQYADLAGGMERRYSVPPEVQQSPATSTEALKELDISVQYARTNRLLNKFLGKIFPDSKADEYSNLFFQLTQDQLLPVGKVIDDLRARGATITDMLDVYRQEEIMHGKQGARLAEAEETLFRPMAMAINRIEVEDAKVNELMSSSEYANKRITANRNDAKTVSGKIATALSRTAPERLGVVDAYLYALHAKERNDYVYKQSEGKIVEGSGMSNAEADRILKWFASLPEAERQALQEVTNTTSKIAASTTKTRVDGGLIPATAVDGTYVSEEGELMFTDKNFSNYVPLRGREDAEGFLEEGVITGSPSKKLGATGKEDPFLLGRQTYAAISPLKMLMTQHQLAIQRDEKNKVIQSAHELIKAYPEDTADLGMTIVDKVPSKRTKDAKGKVRLVPDPEFKQRPEIIPFKVDGKQLYLKVEGKPLQRAFEAIAAPEVVGKVMQSMMTFQRFLANVRTTYSPEFLVSNAARDVQTALFNSMQWDVPELQAQIAKGVPKAAGAVKAYVNGTRTDEVVDYTIPISEASDKQKLARVTEFINAGGKNMLSQMGRAQDAVSNINSLLGEINNDIKNGKDIKQKLFGGVKSLGQTLENWNEVAENMTRVATFNALRERGVSPDQAAQAARNVTTNFSKKGVYGQQLNTFYLFYNAALQGSMASINAATRSPRARKMLGGIIAMGVVNDLLNSFLSDEDENGIKYYDQMADYVLEHNLVFMVPGSNEAVTIPIPYGLNMFFNSGRAASRFIRGAETAGGTATSMFGTVLETFWPFGGSEHSPLTMIAPTLVEPIIELQNNMNWMGSPIYKDAFPNDPGKARAYMHWSSTSASAKAIAQGLNKITGGTPTLPGYIDFSPDQLDYWVNFLFAGTGTFIQRAAEAPGVVSTAFDGTWSDEAWNSVPVTRRVFQSVSERSISGSYFEGWDQLRLIDAELKDAIKTRDRPRAERAVEKYRKELMTYRRVNIINNARRNLATQRNSIIARTDISEDRKDQIIKALRDREMELMQRGIAIMKDM